MGFGDTVKQIQANWGFDVGATDGVDKRSSLIQPRPLSAESLTRPLNHDELLEAYIIHPWSYKAANLIAHKLASVPMVLLRARSQGTSGEQRNKAAARAKRHIRQLKGNTEQGIAYSIAKRHDVKMRTGISIEDIAKAHRLEVVDDHPLLDLLGNVNEEHNFKTLKESISSYLTLHGNSYVHKVRGDGLNQPPTELWSIAPNRVRIVPGTQSDDPFVLGYLVDTGVERKRSVRREDMIHWGFFHPKNDYYGFSPLHSVRDEILADLAAAGYNKAFFENDAEPRGLLTSDQVLDKATADDLRARWEESHRGYENAHRIAVLGLGTTYKQVGLSHRDMHFLELRNFAKSAILGSLGVPPILVGDLGNSSYANAFIQQRLFVEQTILAYMAKFEEPANDSLLAEYPDSDELVLAFDVTRVRELLEDLSEKLDMANTGIQSGMTLNEVRSDVLERDPVDGGDRVFLGANLVPVADESTEERGKSAPTAQRQADDSLVQAPAENFVPPRDQEERAMEEALNPLWAAVIADIGQRTLDELVEGDDPPPFQQGQRVEQFQADRAGLIPNIEGSTRTRILALVHQAIDEGWTVARLRDEVDALYETMIEERAPSIARTEVISAYNFAALEAARQTTVVDRKRWITTLDGRARAAHLSAHGQVRAKGEPYSVGGEALMFPSDPSGSPAMTINCRCTQMFLRRGQQAPEPGEITEGDRQFYKRFTNEVAGLVGGHTPKVQGFLDEQRQRVLTHIEERAES